MNKPPRSWTTGELKIMRANAHLGAAALAELLERSQRSVEAAASRHRISIRRRGESRGTVLGQPRGESLDPAVRATLVDGGALVAERMRVNHEAALCPSCAKREIAVRVSGLCKPCHLRRLRDIHLDRLAERTAQRELWTARQQLKRSRDQEQWPE